MKSASRSRLHALAHHLQAQRVQQHQRVELELPLRAVARLVLAEEVHDGLSRAERLLAVVVVAPEDGLVALQLDELPVPQPREALDDLVGLEPRAVEHEQVADGALHLAEGLAVLVRVEDVGVLGGTGQPAEDFPLVPGLLLALPAGEGVEGDLVGEEAHRRHRALVELLREVVDHVQLQRQREGRQRERRALLAAPQAVELHLPAAPARELLLPRPQLPEQLVVHLQLRNEGARLQREVVEGVVDLLQPQGRRLVRLADHLPHVLLLLDLLLLPAPRFLPALPPLLPGAVLPPLLPLRTALLPSAPLLQEVVREAVGLFELLDQLFHGYAIQMQSKTKSSSLEKESSNPESRKAKEKSLEKGKGRGKHVVTLGVCAMKKKVQSKPMKEILRRLRCKEIEIIEMWQFLEQHWSEWPKVDALICFHSDGFPFLMAWRYVQKHKPFLINNLDKQQLLWDRTVVYDILKRIKVPVAKHYFIFRDHDYLDQIEKRGNGNSVPDPPDLEKEAAAATAEKGKIKQRISLNEPMAFSSFSGYVGTGGSAGKEGKEGWKEGKEVATEGLIYLEANAIKEEEEEVKGNLSEVGLRKAQLKEELEKGKVKSRYSGDPSCASESPTRKNYPSCLRSFCEGRHPDHFKYEVEQSEDTLLIRCGEQVQRLKKPFVEKPFDSQNHEICIYYPESMGGGRKKLFRKVKDCSSNYETNENSIRTEGNFIYEEFLPTNAFDIKVYTIGPYYMYAEARRSPTLDGVVQRNEDGKEIRFPVILSPDEKFICNRIVQEFEQEVCGFDLLRANGKSYVCDVNGWSFVKGNPKYWDDCATILTKKLFGHFFPDQVRDYPMYDQSSQRLPMDTLSLKPKLEELRSIVSIFRHGDRSPKLKLKIKTSDPRFIDFFAGVTKDEIKFKDAKNLTKILEICNNIIAELDNTDPTLKDYLQMKLVLEEGGHFEGFTRKLQLKVVERAEGTGSEGGREGGRESGKESGKEGGTGAAVKGAIRKVMIVLKWGGELSYFGYQDAIELGKKMRMERYDDHDCLSLYSEYRHDLKTYSSDEGRCIKTAAAFLKGFLSIEGELAPIISSMVKADPKAQRLLDCTSSQNHSLLADELQVRLTEIMNREEELLNSYLQYRGEELISEAMLKTIKAIGRPREMLRKLYELIKELVFEIERIYLENWEQDGLHERISHHEQLDDELKCEDIVLVSGRWSKIKKDLFDAETRKFNISKVPEIYDTIRHDFRKNGLIFSLVDQGIKDALFQTAETLAYFVVINEYGITDRERIKVAQDICLPLFEKILIDLMFWKAKNEEGKYWRYKEEEEMTAERAIRTRLYFTSASHIYSLINLLTLADNRYLLSRTPDPEARDALNVLYLGYLSHIEFRLYESLVMSHSDPGRFRLEISFSTEYKKTKKMKEFSLGGNGFNINEISQFIESLLAERKLGIARDVHDRPEKRKHSD